MAGDGDRTVVGFLPEMENDGGGLVRKWSPKLEDGRNWKNNGERTLAEDGERRWRVVRGGRRWEENG